MTLPSVHRFFSDKAWVDGASLSQLDTLAASSPDIRAIAAMPDLHPGKYGPVGIGMLSDDIHPPIVGSDIGCGMGLFQTDLNVRKIKVEKVAERLKVLDESLDRDRVASLTEAWTIEPSPYDVGIGTIGSGNHFCELQAIHEIVDEKVARAFALDREAVFVLVHSGSRALGYSVLERLLNDGTKRLAADTEQGLRYLTEHDRAVRWAKLNRHAIAVRAGEAARADVQAIVDQPHNYLERTQKGILHRKGAAPADRGLVPIPGSRESLSYLVRPLPGADANALATIAHGAGRKHDRGSMHGRIEKVKSVREGMKKNPFGGIIVCEDRNLLIEEAGAAYKNIDGVIEQLVEFGLVEVVATFRPLITFKTGQAHIGRDDGRKQDHRS